LEGTRAFADRWTETNRPVNILINNAGILASREAGRDARGFEAHFSTSHLGHFQLTLALLSALRAANGARVVNVSSGAQRFGRRRRGPALTADRIPSEIRSASIDPESARRLWELSEDLLRK
jgi:NAD(P)-dependent dehydrogenase (short-subunit alcohol dehydrogenase family)